jgi:hypothetical protein
LPSQKVTFVRQATVRPDLPPPPTQNADYRVDWGLGGGGYFPSPPAIVTIILT